MPSTPPPDGPPGFGPGGSAGDLWVFGYGSLMWQPGFAHVEAVHARVSGYRRAFCIYSLHYRGTPRRPGLVLGLDRGGMCEGIAFRVPAAEASSVRRYLRVRELVTGVYREARVPATLLREGRPVVRALVFIAERAHPAYAGHLPLALESRLIRKARGLTGSNLDYVLNTARHLAELGIRERKIERLVALMAPHIRVSAAVGHSPARTAALQRNANGTPPRVPAARMRIGDRRRFLHRLAAT